jgi:hypothetical protein
MRNPCRLKGRLEGIDTTEGSLTCLEGITVTLTAAGRANFGAHRATCPFRGRCTKAAAGRVIVPHQHHDLLVAARAQAGTDAFYDVYRRHRPMVGRPSLGWSAPERRLQTWLSTSQGVFPSRPPHCLVKKTFKSNATASDVLRWARGRPTPSTRQPADN